MKPPSTVFTAKQPETVQNKQKVSSTFKSINLRSRRRRRADVRAQAVVPLCPTLNYSTIL